MERRCSLLMKDKAELQMTAGRSETPSEISHWKKMTLHFKHQAQWRGCEARKWATGRQFDTPGLLGKTAELLSSTSCKHVCNAALSLQPAGYHCDCWPQECLRGARTAQCEAAPTLYNKLQTFAPPPPLETPVRRCRRPAASCWSTR